MNKTDEEIALLVQKGDKEAFGVLIERYEKKIIRYGRKFLNNSADIEDLVQEVFIKTYININGFNTSKRFSPWIYRIAHNEFVNALKKKKSERLHFIDGDTVFPHIASKERADKETDERELRELLDKGLDHLDNKYREPLLFFYMEGMSYKDIADILQIPVSTVGVRVNRGKTALQKIYKKLNLSYEQ